MKTYKFLFTLILIACLAGSCIQRENPGILVTNLRTDYTVNPVGIDNPLPQFSWIVGDDRPGAGQTAYRLLVASKTELLEEGKADLWDSGKQKTHRNRQIVYAGKQLKSSTRYYWRLKLWDKDRKATDYSEPSYFETAYLTPSDWRGKWITNTEDTLSKVAPLFRKRIVVREKPVRATAYVAGVGYHEFYVNGQKATDSFLEPGYTRFDRRVLYLTYDLTRFLVKGENCMGALLGNGWYNVQTRAVWYFEKAPWRKTPHLLADVLLEYADGGIEWISTDDTWKTTGSPMLFNSLYGGEEYDARLEIPGWNSPGYNDSKWLPVLVTGSPGGVLSAQASPSIRLVSTIQPVKIHPLGKGKYLADMGQNFTGTVKLKIQGKAGTKITLRFGERINPDLTLNTERIDEHMRIVPGGHPFQTDIYILKGEGEENYSPRFTYHGYQYIEISTSPALEIKPENLEGLFLSTGFEESGSFRCSNDLLNKLFAATKQSYLSNFYSIPTDCPHREKNGWTGDAHISCEQGLWNYNGIQAYRKWLQDLRDEQRPSGELPGIVPTSGWGYHWGNGPAWDSALPVIAWTLYQYYGDTTVLRENFEAIKKYVDYLTTRTENGIQKIGLGDWVSLVKTPVEITSTGYYFYDAMVLSKMAGILGRPEEEKKYRDLAGSIRKTFNETFLDSVTNRYKIQTQTALSCAVYQGLTPEANEEQTVKDLIAQVEQKNFHPDFGLLGSKYVLNVLHNSGNDEIAYKMLNSTEYPGWGYWIAQGATTLWEDWKGASSLNHIFLGDFTSWFYKAVAGINIDPEYPGFGKFIIKPSFISDLSFVECSYNSVNGKIVSNWKREGNQIEMDLLIPANSEARLMLPDKFKMESSTGNSGPVKLKQFATDGNRIFRLFAGKYRIRLNTPAI